MATGVLGLGFFFLLGALAITVLPSYARIGPRFFPYIVGCGLIGVGLLLLSQAIRARRARYDQAQASSRAADDWIAVSWIAAGLALSVALMERAGYVLAMTLLFILAARGLGSQRPITSALAGFILALGTYFAFTRLLDLHLPGGWLGTIIS